MSPLLPAPKSIASNQDKINGLILEKNVLPKILKNQHYIKAQISQMEYI